MNEETIDKIVNILIEGNVDVDDFIWDSVIIVDKLYEMRDTNKYFDQRSSLSSLDELTAQAQELDMGYN